MKSLDRAQLDSLFAAAAKESAEDALMLRVTFNHGRPKSFVSHDFRGVPKI